MNIYDQETISKFLKVEDLLKSSDNIRLGQITRKTSLNFTQLAKILDDFAVNYENNLNYKVESNNLMPILNKFKKHLDINNKFPSQLFSTYSSNILENEDLLHLFFNRGNHFKEDLILKKFDTVEEGTVFKFYPFNNNTKECLEEGSIYHSDPKNFNDPYDCSLELYLSRESPNKKQISDLKNFLSHLRVASFSQRNDSITMWSHYANKHQGICLEFNAQDIVVPVLHDSKIHKTYIKNYEGLLSKLYNVKYTSIYSNPKSNPLSIRENIPNLFLRKYHDWAYEKEVRKIHYSSKLNDANSNKSFYNKNAIKSIYIGTKANKETVDYILDLNKRKFNNRINIFQAFLTNNEFQLKFKELKHFNL